MDEVRILIVDDEEPWRASLEKMYRNVFADRLRPRITTVATGDDALEALERERFALLSCDINLSQSGSRANVIDGRKVLAYAGEYRRVSGAVIPTAISHDARFHLVDPKGGVAAQLDLTGWLRAWFDSDFLRLDKTAEASPEESASVWAGNPHIRNAILALTSAWPAVPPPYTIGNRGTEYQPSIIIYTTGRSDGRQYEVPNSDDARFVYELCELSRHDQEVPFDMVAAIYNSQRPQLKVDELSKQLRRAGLDPDAIYEKKRGSGWAKLATVRLGKGFHSVQKMWGADPETVSANDDPEERLLSELDIDFAGRTPVDALADAIDKLDPLARSMVTARFFDEKSIGEIADDSGYAHDVVEKVIASSLEKLRSSLRRPTAN